MVRGIIAIKVVTGRAYLSQGETDGARMITTTIRIGSATDSLPIKNTGVIGSLPKCQTQW